MPVWDFNLSDGSTITLESESEPTDEQVLDAARRYDATGSVAPLQSSDLFGEESRLVPSLTKTTQGGPPAALQPAGVLLPSLMEEQQLLEPNEGVRIPGLSEAVKSSANRFLGSGGLPFVGTPQPPEQFNAVQKLASGAIQGVDELVEGVAQYLTSTPGIVEVSASKTPLAPAVYLKWANDMVRGGMLNAGEAYDAMKRGDWETFGKNVVGGLGMLLGAGAVTKHGVTKIGETAKAFSPGDARIAEANAKALEATMPPKLDEKAVEVPPEVAPTPEVEPVIEPPLPPEPVKPAPVVAKEVVPTPQAEPSEFVKWEVISGAGGEWFVTNGKKSLHATEGKAQAKKTAAALNRKRVAVATTGQMYESPKPEPPKESEVIPVEEKVQIERPQEAVEPTTSTVELNKIGQRLVKEGFTPEEVDALLSGRKSPSELVTPRVLDPEFESLSPPQQEIQLSEWIARVKQIMEGVDPDSGKPVVAPAAPGKVEITPEMSIHQKEQILGDLVRDKIINAPSFQKLVAATKAFKKSLHGRVSEEWLAEQMKEPWNFLSAHSGVMNAKSARAQTLRSLADAVIREANLPMMKPGKFRGMDYQIDWDKLTASPPAAVTPAAAEVKPSVTPKQPFTQARYDYVKSAIETPGVLPKAKAKLIKELAELESQKPVPPTTPVEAKPAAATKLTPPPAVEPGQGGVPYYRKLGEQDALDPARKRMRSVPQNFKLAYIDGWYAAKKSKPTSTPQPTPPPQAAAKVEGKTVAGEPYELDFESASGDRIKLRVSSEKYSDLSSEAKDMVDRAYKTTLELNDKDFSKWEKIKQGKSKVTVTERIEGSGQSRQGVTLDSPETEFGRWAVRDDLYDAKLNPPGESLRNKLVTEREAATKAKEDKEAADRAEQDRKAREFREYSDTISQTTLPAGKKTSMAVENKEGVKSQIEGTRYGDWFIHKVGPVGHGRYADPAVYKVSHFPSGLGISDKGLPTLEQAKNYVRALNHAKVRTNWKKPSDLSKEERAAILQVGRAWVGGGDVPEYFKSTQPQPPSSVGTGAGEKPIGMGGAVPGEFEQSAQTPTSIKNAQVDVERAKRGLPPAIQPARRSFGEVWDRAMAKIDNDPGYPDRLIGELRDKPRALTDLEDATILHRQIDLQNEYGKATRDLAQAFDDGRMDAVGNEKARVAALSDQLLDLYNVGKKVGTETGRGLAARKMLAYEDFSLATMELEKRAVNEGRQLTDAERAEVVRHNETIERTTKAYEEDIAKKDQRIAELESKQVTHEIISQVKKTSPKKQRTPDAIDADQSKTKENIRLRLDEGKRSEITNLVQKLARLFVERGIRERDALIDAVHGVLKEIDPEFTRRETMDAISGYGDFKQLTKDEISVKLRDLKGQMQQVAKLEDMQAGRPPMKTGLERRIPSPEESRLIKLVNEAKNQFQIPIDDPATQLKSSLDTLKTRLKNREIELRGMLERGEFTKKPKRIIQMDAESNRLHFAMTKAKIAWHEAMMKDRLAKRSLPQKIFASGAEILNTSRAILTSLDLSAVLRQGGFITLSHPIRAAKSFPAMFRAFRSEAGQHAANMEIANRKNFPLYNQAKLYLSEHGHKLSQMEEAYMSRWADKIPLVAGSQRAYVTFLNKLRADSFDAMANSLARERELTPAEANAIANFVNVATGRGNLGMKENALVGLNTIFFAPRYVASRFQLMAGQPLYRGSARTRIAIAKEYARYMIGVGIVYGLAQLDGATIEQDPRSSDFGKLRYGNTRIDPMSGLLQNTVLLSRLSTGQTKNARGKLIPIRGDKIPYGGANSSEVVGRFLRSKLSPALGTGLNVLTGKDVVGQPVTASSTAQNLLVPLAWQDIYNAMKEQGLPHGTIMAILSVFGMGVQNYDSRKPKQ